MIAPDTLPAPSGSSPPHPWGDPAAWEVGGRKGKRNSSAAGMMSRCLSRVLFVFRDQRSCPWAVGLGAGCASCPVGKGWIDGFWDMGPSCSSAVLGEGFAEEEERGKLGFNSWDCWRILVFWRAWEGLARGAGGAMDLSQLAPVLLEIPNLSLGLPSLHPIPGCPLPSGAVTSPCPASPSTGRGAPTSNSPVSSTSLWARWERGNPAVIPAGIAPLPAGLTLLSAAPSQRLQMFSAHLEDASQLFLA